jgi:CO/xanthine dehydrogenase FAD-binding subunit
MQFESPTSIKAALTLLAQGFKPLAGGTDYYPSKVGEPLRESLLNLMQIAGLRYISELDSGGFDLGSMATWRDCLKWVQKPNTPNFVAVLGEAAAQVGGWQVQNRGTIGGNLCNASPAADGTVALLALDAKVTLARAEILPNKEIASVLYRRLDLIEFVLGNRQTAKAPGELLTAVHVPGLSRRAQSAFCKLGNRKYLVISIVMVAVVLDFDEAGGVVHCRIAVGSCNKAAVRVQALEARLIGTPVQDVVQKAQQNLQLIDSIVQPIDDVRGTAVYRRDAAGTLVLRALAQCVAKAQL